MIRRERARLLWEALKPVIRPSWPVWLFIAFVVGLWGAWGQGAQSAERTPCPPPSPVVFCPTEDACRPEWNGQHWVIVRVTP